MDQGGTWRGGGPCPGLIVLGGTQLPSLKKVVEPPPIFGPLLLWPIGWMHQDAT